MMTIHAQLCGQIFPKLEDDEVFWIPSQAKNFSVGATWRYLRPQQSKVIWDSIVHFKCEIPKHSCISWLAVLNRLSTKVRQHKITPNF